MFLFEILITYVILYVCEDFSCSISRELWRNIELSQKKFLAYNFQN